VTTCSYRISPSAQINIAIASSKFPFRLSHSHDSHLLSYIVVILLLLLLLIICLIGSRRARAAAEQEYNVEASQVDGPPTIIATEYHPTSGPSGVYEGPKSSFGVGQTSAQMTGPTYPVAAQVYNQNRTAPVAQTTFPYPVPSYSPVSPSSMLLPIDF
jgi:hypothetical protein